MRRFVKNVIKNADSKILGSRLSKTKALVAASKANRSLGAHSSDFAMVYKFGDLSDEAIELSGLCDLYGTDKGSIGRAHRPYKWQAHSYALHYAELFTGRREEIKAVLEIGIGTNDPSLPSSMGLEGKPGASLRVWRDYFPKAYIVGADIDRKILFDEDRIRTFFVDQMRAETFEELWSSVETDDFDLIIDDGLHSFEAARTTFDCSFSHLAPGGLYIVEDLSVVELQKMRDHLSGHQFEVRIMPRKEGLSDRNNLLIVYNA